MGTDEITGFIALIGGVLIVIATLSFPVLLFFALVKYVFF